jgi:hypothetical protein
LEFGYTDHELFRNSVIPSLETNRLRLRVHAIQKSCPINYRAKVLGRSLLAARADANRFWMLLSGNAEVAFPTTTATNAAAVSLPITTANNGEVSAAVAAAPGTSTGNDATPTIGQKRKAYA